MFEAVFESLQKATDSTIRMQQELFKQWVGLMPVQPTPAAAPVEQAQKVQKKWAEVAGDLYKKQCEALEAQFKVGLRNLEEGFRLAKTKDPEELRAKTVELWQKSLDCLRQSCEAQFKEFQTAMAKWTEVVMKSAAGTWAST
jgi:hypothetical protein